MLLNFIGNGECVNTVDNYGLLNEVFNSNQISVTSRSINLDL
jgi:hypothetical protein